MQKYKLRFQDGDIFRDEDGNTEFSARKCKMIEDLMRDYAILERVPVGASEDGKCPDGG